MSEEREIEVEATSSSSEPDGDPTPELPPRGCMGTSAALAGAVLGSIYLLNPGWGMFELLPDVLPVVGNLDEAGAAALVIFALRYVLKSRN